MVSREVYAVGWVPSISSQDTISHPHLFKKNDSQILSDIISMGYSTELSEGAPKFHGSGPCFRYGGHWTSGMDSFSENLENITLNQKEKPRELIDCKAGAIPLVCDQAVS